MLLGADRRRLSMISEMMVARTDADTKIQMFMANAGAIDRTQSLRWVFGFLPSFVPPCRNALAHGQAGSDQVWSLLNSKMSGDMGS